MLPDAESELKRKLAAAQAIKSVPAAKPGEVIYQSKAFAYRFQLTAAADRIDPATGVLVRARPEVAQFQQGQYRTSKEDHIKRLDSSPQCGVGRDFWRAEEMLKAASDKQISDLVGAVKATGDQSLIARIVAELSPEVGKTEFALPPRPPQADAVQAE